MTERLNVTTEAGESAAFSPVSEFYVQVSAVQLTTVFDVMARADANAPWAAIDTISVNDRICRYAALPFVKIAVRGNQAGSAAKAWTSP